jgi:hypothetical protein
MDRRQFNSVSLTLGFWGLISAANQAQALSLSDLTNGDATKGLKTALEKGALSAVSVLGVQDGFFGNEMVHIHLPEYLEDGAKILRNFGMGGQIDALVLAMNRAAEAAVPMAKDLLVKTVQSMNVNDAKTILAGGDTAATEYFSAKTRPALAVKFLPIVVKATEKVGLVEKYNQFAGKAAEYGLVKKEDANIQQYVTGKALDGLFLMISEEEKKIRRNPLSYGRSILSKVFGAMQ